MTKPKLGGGVDISKTEPELSLGVTQGPSESKLAPEW